MRVCFVLFNQEDKTMLNPPIPTMPCFACGIMTNETQSRYGVGHHRCFVEYKPTHGEWLPIETAPKDGTEVLVYGLDYDEQVIAIVEWDATNGVYSRGPMGDYFSFDEPTHWMPLPAPPTGT
jgi:hypothetical protein